MDELRGGIGSTTTRHENQTIKLAELMPLKPGATVKGISVLDKNGSLLVLYNSNKTKQ
jgi:hypothetical protein